MKDLYLIVYSTFLLFIGCNSKPNHEIKNTSTETDTLKSATSSNSSVHQKPDLSLYHSQLKGGWILTDYSTLLHEHQSVSKTEINLPFFYITLAIGEQEIVYGDSYHQQEWDYIPFEDISFPRFQYSAYTLQVLALSKDTLVIRNNPNQGERIFLGVEGIFTFEKVIQADEMESMPAYKVFAKSMSRIEHHWFCGKYELKTDTLIYAIQLTKQGEILGHPLTGQSSSTQYELYSHDEQDVLSFSFKLHEEAYIKESWLITPLNKATFILEQIDEIDSDDSPIVKKNQKAILSKIE